MSDHRRMIVAMISRMLASTSAALVIGVASGVSGCVDHDGAAAIVFGQPGLTCKFVAANHSCNDHLQQQTFFIRDLTISQSAHMAAASAVWASECQCVGARARLPARHAERYQKRCPRHHHRGGTTTQRALTSTWPRSTLCCSRPQYSGFGLARAQVKPAAQ